MGLPSTITEAPEGTVVSSGVPPGACNTMAGSSMGLDPTSTSRRSIWYPGRLRTSTCLPGGASISHGVVQPTSERPSKTAVAPPGRLMTVTGWAAARTGCDRDGDCLRSGASLALPPLGAAGGIGLGLASAWSPAGAGVPGPTVAGAVPVGTAGGAFCAPGCGETAAGPLTPP